jgi:hypothetical protein
MVKPHSYIEIAFESVKVFTNDGQLDLQELNFLLGLALRDEQVDDDERRVLARIFAQAEKGRLAPPVQARIAEVRARHGIPAA